VENKQKEPSIKRRKNLQLSKVSDIKYSSLLELGLVYSRYMAFCLRVSKDASQWPFQGVLQRLPWDPGDRWS
jgi:hypothetical protein